MHRLSLRVAGVVQGIGFRPWVYRLAHALQLSGFVHNTPEGALIEIQGDELALQRFKQALLACNLIGFKASQLVVTDLATAGDSRDFRILLSTANQPTSLTLFLDSKPCVDCLNELRDPDNVRFNYPFISCCSCGPRYSISLALPFDRETTTMKYYNECERCKSEYRNPGDRRFHSQINSCPDCGPQLMGFSGGSSIILPAAGLIAEAVSHLKRGNIIAIKGIGGYQLVGIACDQAVIRRLRILKRRDEKPFAVMVADFRVARQWADFNEVEKSCFEDARCPIVLVRKRQARKTETNNALELLAPGLKYIGLMMPSSPLHLMLAEACQEPLAITSGNLPDEPMIFLDEEAKEKLSPLCSFILYHDREIAAPLDDSVVQIVCDQVMVMRAGRGYAPLAISDIFPGMFSDKVGFGAHQRNTCSLYAQGSYVLSPYIGDLTARATQVRATYVRSLLQTQLRIRTPLILRDLQPNYASSIQADETGQSVEVVQHHFSHAFAEVLEHGITGDFLTAVWDGFGLGTDGSLWGGEFIQRNGNRVDRVASFRSFPVLGGERMAVDTSLSALSLLTEAYPGEEETWVSQLSIPLDLGDVALHLQRCRRPQAVLRTSSAGRLIDGVCCLLSVAAQNGYEGHAAMLLNDMGTDTTLSLSYELQKTEIGMEVDWRPLIREICTLRINNVAVEEIVGRFWNTMAAILCDMTMRRNATTILLAGGCFQGRQLLRRAVQRLRNSGIQVCWPQRVPAGDGSISLGQVVASNFMESIQNVSSSTRNDYID